MEDLINLKADLLSSLLLFTRTFYPLRTGRDFGLSKPTARESHFISICREFTKVFNGETKRLIINIPPRYGKSELAIHFITWALAHYPDSNFLYVSCAHSLAVKSTKSVRDIICLPQYKKAFNVKISEANSAKDDFETTSGGSVYGVGAGGTIVGRGAGIMHANRFAGCLIIDDIHKPDEVTSDTIREGAIDWYDNTLRSRINDKNTPIIFIGQRLHEDDLIGHILKSENDWSLLSLPALDDLNNPLYPEKHSKEELFKLKEKNRYIFASQYQQNPIPPGGALFKKDDFVLLNEEPKILKTFITCDTAETDKDYNDATVFSFWGLYKIIQNYVETDIYALHWLDCLEIRVEPSELESEMMSFYTKCMQHSVKPEKIAIEKKSTGVTLVSVLKKIRGLNITDIERTRVSGSKTKRFIEMQPIIASKLISLPRLGNHTEMCVNHCIKITANDSHAHDDIADTLYDAIKLALIDKVLIADLGINNTKQDEFARSLYSKHNRIEQLKSRRVWQI